MICKPAPESASALSGQTAAEKTTILKMLAGLLRPTSGESVRGPKVRIGYMPQTLAPDWSMPMTARDFIRLRPAPARFEDKLSESMQSCGLSRDVLSRQLRALSGGELRRLFLARLLMDENLDLLALDEPTQGMDVRGESEFYGVVEKFLGDNPGAGALIVSHDLERVMLRSDRVYCVDGTIRCHGAGDDVIRDPALSEMFRGHIGLYRHHHHHNGAGEARG